MKKIIISTDYLKKETYTVIEFIKILLDNNNFEYLILTRDELYGNKVVDYLRKKYNLNCSFLKRDSKNISNDFEFIIGNKDKDFQLATNRRKIIFYDSNIKCENKVKEYGIPFNLKNLNKILKITALQKNIYCFTELENSVKVISLINAKYKYGPYTQEEKELIKNFETFLKKGETHSSNYLLILYVLLTIQSLNLNKPDFIFYYPSSKKEKNSDNCIMKKITSLLRNLYHLRLEEEPLLERIVDVTPSKMLNTSERLDCFRHFKSISYNNSYDQKLKNKNIWVLDDYCTNGTSFEVVRNFLKDKNLNSLTLISIGNFGKNYIKQEYENIFKDKPLLKEKVEYKITILENYKNTIDDLTEIINN